MNADQLKSVYAESLAFVQMSAVFKFIISVALIVVGLLMGMFLLLIVQAPPPVGLLVIGVCLGAAAYNGRNAYTDYRGKPVVLTAKIVKKDDVTRTSSNGQTSHQYSLHLDITQAFSVDVEGNKTDLPRLNGPHKFSATDVIWSELSDQEETTLVATPSYKVFARLSDFIPASEAVAQDQLKDS